VCWRRTRARLTVKHCHELAGEHICMYVVGEELPRNGRARTGRYHWRGACSRGASPSSDLGPACDLACMRLAASRLETAAGPHIINCIIQSTDFRRPGVESTSHTANLAWLTPPTTQTAMQGNSLCMTQSAIRNCLRVCWPLDGSTCCTAAGWLLLTPASGRACDISDLGSSTWALLPPEGP
jgi:hypothetical protein